MLGLVLLLLLRAAPAFAGAGVAVAPPEPAAGAGPDTAATAVRPGLRGSLEGPLLGAGASLLLGSVALDATLQSVPPEGRDPGEVHWSFDRTNLGKRDADADSRSDYVRDAAVAYPLAVAFVSQPPGERLGGTLRRSVVYLEALLIAQGATSILKNSIDRPRPYTYLPSDQRPDDPAYDVTVGEAFRSMPSGHATTAFCGAAFAMTDHLLTRPGAGWLERAGVSFAGGLLAGMTAAMRVEAGQHFPSDVIVSGLIGTSSGVVLPLAHRYIGAGGRPAPPPSGAAWRQGIAGLLAGIGTGILVAESLR